MDADLNRTLRSGTYELRREVLEEQATAILKELGSQRHDMAERAARHLVEELDRIAVAEIYLHSIMGVANGT